MPNIWLAITTTSSEHAMKKTINFLASSFLLLSLLSAGACSSKDGGTDTSQIPDGEVITVKSATPERDFSLHVIADRDDYGQKDMEFYVSAESPIELHELVKSNIGKKIRIAWADGLISAAEELEGEKRFAGAISLSDEGNSTEGDPPSESILGDLAPLNKVEADLTYGENLNAVVANIATYSPKNLQIVATCLTASRVYRKIVLPQMGEDAMVSDGSPSAADADKIHDALLNLTVAYAQQLNDEETFDSVLKTLDEEGFNHFYLPADESGNREFNLKNWGKWYGVPLVSACRNIAAPFLEEGVDPMGIVRE